MIWLFNYITRYDISTWYNILSHSYILISIMLYIYITMALAFFKPLTGPLERLPYIYLYHIQPYNTILATYIYIYQLFLVNVCIYIYILNYIGIVM